jgi:hypothetical protein
MSMAILIGIVIGAVIWAVLVRPWQRKQYERELRERRRR